MHTTWITKETLISHHNSILYEWSWKYDNLVNEILNSNKILSFLDIGANTGAVIEFILKKQKIANIYAVEPLEKNCEMLQSLQKKYNSEEINMHIFPLAIYYGITEAQACGIGDRNTGGMFLDAVVNDLELKHNTMKTGFVFKCDTLENILRDTESIDLCKIDIEGSEWNLIKHSSFLKTKIKNILLEIHWLDEPKAIDFLNNYLSEFSIIKIVHNTIWLKQK
jgi:FkbM family methyltransferase